MKLRFLILGATVVFATSCDVRTKPDSGCQNAFCGVGGGFGGGFGVSGGGTGITTGGGNGTTGGGNGTTGGGNGTTGGGNGVTGGGSGVTGGGAGFTGGGSGTTGGGTGTIFGWDGGTSVGAVKNGAFCADHVTLENAVVIGIDSFNISTSTGTPNFLERFWVQDVNDREEGLFVEFFYDQSDIDPDAGVRVGDVVSVTGYMQSNSKFTDRTGYRKKLANAFRCDGGTAMEMHITGSNLPVANDVDAGFGNAREGTVQAGYWLGGTLVHIPGPVELTVANPAPFKRISAIPDDSTYFGFELDGGVLVNNFYTYDAPYRDGGCDWRKVALDGGHVVFADGITGIWDTFTHASCVDGGVASGCFANAGSIPDTTKTYTYVLYPLSCGDFGNVEVTTP